MRGHKYPARDGTVQSPGLETGRGPGPRGPAGRGARPPPGAAILACALQNRVPARDILSELKNRHTLHMLAVIAAIFIFKDVLGATGVAEALAASAGKEAVLITAAVLVPFLVGMVSGITMAYVGAAFPLLMAVIPMTPSGPDMAWITLAILCGYTGVLISPLHICFIFSCSYYQVDLAGAWRRLVAPCAVFLAASPLYAALMVPGLASGVPRRGTRGLPPRAASRADRPKPPRGVRGGTAP